MTTILVDSKIEKAIISSGYQGLYIKNTDIKHIGPTFIHLRISDKRIFSSIRGNIDIIDNKVVILPGESISIETMEEFIMPLNIVGTLHSRVWLVVKELYVPNTIIDPGYRGVLRIVIFNSSSEERQLMIGDYIGKIMLYELDDSASRGVDKQDNRNDIVEMNNSMDSNIKKNSFLKNRRIISLLLFSFLVVSMLLSYLFITPKSDAVIVIGMLVAFAQFLLFLSTIWK